MKVAKASVGAKRYKLGTSNAPTRGKVNPGGYIKREISNRNKAAGRGNDGKSDRRSGLAKTALNTATRYMSNGPGKMQNPTFRNVFHTPKFGPKSGYKPAPSRPVTKQPRPNPTSPGGLPTGQSDAFVQPMPNIPTVQINENGQLDLPFDEAFGLDLVNQQQQMNMDLLGLQQDQQAQQMDYANSMRDLGLQYDDVKRGTLNSNAAGGTAFSSQYAVGASRNTQNFNNAQNDLNAANAAAMSGFNQQRMGIQNAMNDYIRQAVLQQAMNMSGEAGDLGYGEASPEPINYGSNKPNKPSRPVSRIDRLRGKGLDKSQIVARLTGTKDGSGAAKTLSKSTLRDIGFSDKFINSVKSNNKKKK